MENAKGLQSSFSFPLLCISFLMNECQNIELDELCLFLSCVVY